MSYKDYIGVTSKAEILPLLHDRFYQLTARTKHVDFVKSVVKNQDYLFLPPTSKNSETKEMSVMKMPIFRAHDIPLNVYNDNFKRGSIWFRSWSHPISLMWDTDHFYRSMNNIHMQWVYHTRMTHTLFKRLPESLEDFFERMFVNSITYSNGLSVPFDGIPATVTPSKLNPMYYGFVLGLSENLSKALLWMSVAGSLKPAKTLYDTLFLDNLVDVFGWEGKPVRWVTGPYSLLAQTESEELKTFRAFMRDMQYTSKPPRDFTGDIMTFKSICQTEVFYIEPEKPGRWVLKPFWINFWGEIEYKLHKTDEPKPDYSRIHVKSRSEIRKL